MITKEDARKLACAAWDAAIKHIQDQMGVTGGDVAGQFFSEPCNEQYMVGTIDMLQDYIELEYDTSEKEPTL